MLLVNAGLGFILIEWSWYKTRYFRKPIKELNDLMPSFRRNDAAKWSRWRFYPGALTIMLPRFFLAVGLGIILLIILKIMLICQPMDQPIRGCRRVIIRWSYKFLTYIFQLFANFCVTTWKHVPREEVNFYEEWLGPLDEQEKEQRGENPMM